MAWRKQESRMIAEQFRIEALINRTLIIGDLIDEESYMRLYSKTLPTLAHACHFPKSQESTKGTNSAMSICDIAKDLSINHVHD